MDPLCLAALDVAVATPEYLGAERTALSSTDKMISQPKHGLEDSNLRVQLDCFNR